METKKRTKIVAGYQNFNWAFDVVGLRGSHYVALLALVDESHGTETIERLSLRTLARKCNVTHETARQLTRDLERWDFIRREARDLRKMCISNRYRLNRSRIYPKSTGPEGGEIIGGKMWRLLLDKLDERKHVTHLLRSQIREAYYDRSSRDTTTGNNHGTLYLFGETNTADRAFKELLPELLNHSKIVPPYVIEYLDLKHRRRFAEPA